MCRIDTKASNIHRVFFCIVAIYFWTIVSQNIKSVTTFTILPLNIYTSCYPSFLFTMPLTLDDDGVKLGRKSDLCHFNSVI